jgi:glycosyltransferase involved in cell wall biosynthesis
MTPSSASSDVTGASDRPPVRLVYLVSHPIQYQAPLLRRIAREPGIDLTVLFGSDFSIRGYKDDGFGVQVSWDTPLLEGYNYEFLPNLRDTGGLSLTSPISRGIYTRLRQLNPDAVWIHGYASVNALHGILAANALGIPVLLRAESWLADRARSSLKLALKHLFFKALGAGISAVLPIGSVNSHYWSHYIPSVPQFLMPYAVDNSYFASLAAEAAPREAALRAELNLTPGRPVILFASKLQTRKHADHLVEAYRTFISTLDPASAPYLVIVGDGEERANLEARVAALHLAGTDGPECVRFAGFRNQSELPRFFQMSSVFVLPSRHEPWGLIVNEAMAAACPVIVSTDVGSAADLVAPNPTWPEPVGCVYPVGDVAALTDALRIVFATPETARHMGLAAQRRMSTWGFEQDVFGLRAALAYTTRKLRA